MIAWCLFYIYIYIYQIMNSGQWNVRKCRYYSSNGNFIHTFTTPNLKSFGLFIEWVEHSSPISVALLIVVIMCVKNSFEILQFFFSLYFIHENFTNVWNLDLIKKEGNIGKMLLFVYLKWLQT